MRQGYVVLKAVPSLQEEDYLYLATEAVYLYYDADKKQTDVKNQNLEGRLFQTEKHVSLGQFSGPYFRAEIETNTGKQEYTFFLNELHDPTLN